MLCSKFLFTTSIISKVFDWCFCLKPPSSHSKSNKIPPKWLLHLQNKRTNTGTCNSSSLGSDTFTPWLNFLLSFHLMVNTFPLLKLLWTWQKSNIYYRAYSKAPFQLFKAVHSVISTGYSNTLYTCRAHLPKGHSHKLITLQNAGTALYSATTGICVKINLYQS